MRGKKKTGKIRKTWWMQPATSETLDEWAKSSDCFYGELASVGEFLDLLAKGSIGRIGDEWIIKFPQKQVRKVDE